MTDLVAPLLAALEAAPAGGATASEIAIGGAVIGSLTALLFALGLAHRAGRTELLNRAAAPLARRTGLPGWAVLPPLVSLVALLAAGPGFAWDVALHISNGRDLGPFANPSHYPILLGAYGFFVAGFLAVVMPRGQEAGPAAVRLAPGWRAPAAGVAMLACGSFSLLGFPLDDVWHRLFGQDVTLWGPTHLMLISGGLLHFVAAALLLREGRLAVGIRGASGGSRAGRLVSLAFVGGVLLGGLTIAFQQEFGYGVPQFRLTFQPMLIALSAALVLVPIRLAAGRGAALATVGVAIAIQAAVTAIVLALGQPTLHFPPYVAEGLLVEVVALVLARRPYVFGVVAGVLVGSVGTVAEWGWSHLWMPIAWPASLLPEAIALSVAVAALGGAMGAFCARTLRDGRGKEPAPAIAGWAGAMACLVVAMCVLATQLPTHAPSAATARVELTDVAASPGRAVHATVRFDPSATAEGADWLYGMAWQGGEDRLVAAPMRRVGEGTYRTTEPLPVNGTWKAAIRLHRGGVMALVPLHLPADAAIPAAALPAPARFERAMVEDAQFLQRERKPSVDGPLWPIAASLVALAVVALVGLVLWTLLRVARIGPPSASAPAGRTAPAPVPRTAAVTA